MADYRLIVSAHSRSKGHSATAAAAYRTASRVCNERPGELHNYSRKGGILRSEIALPRDFVVSPPAEFTAAQCRELTMSLAGEIARRASEDQPLQVVDPRKIVRFPAPVWPLRGAESAA